MITESALGRALGVIIGSWILCLIFWTWHIGVAGTIVAVIMFVGAAINGEFRRKQP